LTQICRKNNQNTHFIFDNFFPENRAVHEAMWKKYDTARQSTDDNIIGACAAYPEKLRLKIHTQKMQ